MSNSWAQAIQQLHPAYFEWKDQMEQIIPQLKQKGKKWYVVFPVEYIDNSEEFIDPIAEELNSWENTTRMAYNMWAFEYKRDAEKLITLYYLKWTR